MPAIRGAPSALVAAFALCLLSGQSAQAQPYAYIVNGNDDVVTVFDTVTHAIVAQIPVGGPTDVAVDPVRPRVYTSGFIDRFAVIDTETNEVIARKPNLDRDQRPWNLAVHPTGDRVYLTLPDFRDSGTLQAVDPVQMVGRGKVRLSSGQTDDVDVHPSGRFAYVTCSGTDDVAVIDARSLQVVNRIPVGSCPDHVIAHPDGKRVFVANNCAGTLSVIDAATNTVIRTIAQFASALALNPAGTFLYLGDHDTANALVKVMDAATYAVVAQVPLGDTLSYPAGIAVHPQGTFVYVTHFWEDSLAVIDAATNTLVATVPAGNMPTDIVVAR